MEEEYITREEEVIEDTSQTEDQTVQEETQVSDYSTLYSDQIELTNHLLAGQIFFIGLIFGCLVMKVFFDRWKV